jgi:hypothetical protein
LTTSLTLFFGVVQDQLDVGQQKAEYALAVARKAPPPAVAAHVDAWHILQRVIDEAGVGVRVFGLAACGPHRKIIALT